MTAVLQFYAELEDIDPRIWRRLQIRTNQTFWGLHCALQDAFGWEDCHLHSFFIGGGSARLEFGLPVEGEPGDRTLPSWEQGLDEICAELPFEMLYVYDFGDDWRHHVRLEGIFPAERGGSYPRCVGGERAGPPEDVGGPYGYKEFLEALGNRRHPEHEAMREWIGREFDPEAFDPAAVVFGRPTTRLRRAGLAPPAPAVRVPSRSRRGN